MKYIMSSPVLRQWIPIAFIVSVCAGITYSAVQQNYRQNANDPQIQIANDLSQILSSGTHKVAELNPGAAADIAPSLTPFIIVYGKDGKAIVGSGKLNGAYPIPPQGVFDNAKVKGENRVTWEPVKGVRIAAVIRPYEDNDQSGYILVGRSLRLIEERISALTKMIAAGWRIALLGAYALMTLFMVPKTSAPEVELLHVSDDITDEEEMKELDKKAEKKKKDFKDEEAYD